jgi:hypothetical protein
MRRGDIFCRARARQAAAPADESVPGARLLQGDDQVAVAP